MLCIYQIHTLHCFVEFVLYSCRLYHDIWLYLGWWLILLAVDSWAHRSLLLHRMLNMMQIVIHFIGSYWDKLVIPVLMIITKAILWYTTSPKLLLQLLSNSVLKYGSRNVTTVLLSKWTVKDFINQSMSQEFVGWQVLVKPLNYHINGSWARGKN